jgi:hypothetical protein
VGPVINVHWPRVWLEHGRKKSTVEFTSSTLMRPARISLEPPATTIPTIPTIPEPPKRPRTALHESPMLSPQRVRFVAVQRAYNRAQEEDELDDEKEPGGSGAVGSASEHAVTRELVTGGVFGREDGGVGCHRYDTVGWDDVLRER